MASGLLISKYNHLVGFSQLWRFLKRNQSMAVVKDYLRIHIRSSIFLRNQSKSMPPFLQVFFTYGQRFFKTTGCVLSISVFTFKAIASSQPASGASLRQFLAEADKLHKSGSEAEAYKRLKAALASGDPAFNCAEVYWRLARGARAMANSCGSEPGEQADKRRAFTYEAFDMAQRGLTLEPNNGSCHKWMGIMISLTSSYEGTKKRIENSYLIRDHLRLAADADSGDAVVLHCLGAWCFEVADLPWYQRQLAAAFFATPPTSSYKEALGYLLKAEAADPNFYSCNLLYIGKAYLRQGDRANARVYLQQTLDYKGDTFDDRQSREEASQLLKQC